MRSLASEFPNDNESLHGGTVWTVGTPLGAAEPILRVSRESGIAPRGALAGRDGQLALADLVAAFDGYDAHADEDLLGGLDVFGGEGPEIVDDLDAFSDGEGEGHLPSADEAGEKSDEPAEPRDESFLVLVERLVAFVAAESPLAARTVEYLLLGEGSAPALDDATNEALRAGGIVDEQGVRQASFVASVAGWRSFLGGADEDFLLASGGAMLDEWAAELVVRVLGAPARVEAVRKELRARGIAAFGLAWAA